MLAAGLSISLPPLPPTDIPWQGMHVLVVHFPIALLLVAPLFVLLGLIFAPRWQGFAVSAVFLLILGTVGTFVAAATGEAAHSIVEKGPDEMFEVMEEHEETALLVRNIYTGITLAYAAFVLLCLTVSSVGKAVVRIPISIVFLIAMGIAALYLAHAAHLGGRLVHEYGVTARLTQKPVPAENSDKPAGEAKQKTEAAAPGGEQKHEESAEKGESSEQPTAPSSTPETTGESQSESSAATGGQAAPSSQSSEPAQE